MERNHYKSQAASNNSTPDSTYDRPPLCPPHLNHCNSERSERNILATNHDVKGDGCYI
jgi:hypothetical protein